MRWSRLKRLTAVLLAIVLVTTGIQGGSMGISAKAAEDGSDDGSSYFEIYAQSSTYVYIDEGATRELVVSYEGNIETNDLEIRWSFSSGKGTYTELGRGNIETDDNGTYFKYTTEAAEKTGKYRLEVSYGELRDYVDFYQQVGDYTYASVINSRCNLYDPQFNALEATLSNPSEDVYCIWKDSRYYDEESGDYRVIAEGENLLSLPVGSLLEFDNPYYVYLTIYNKYETSSECNFYVTKVNLDYLSTEQNEFTVEAGDNLSFSVTAEALDTSLVSYTWYIQDGSSHYRELEGVNGNTYSVENIRKNAVYRVTATDQFGMSFTEFFYVNIPKRFSAASAIKDENGYETTYVYTTYGNSVELAVEVTTENNAEYSVEWKRQYSDKEYDENGDSFTTDEIKGYTSYYATVSDPYGNSETIYFTVNLENDFTFEEMNDTDVEYGSSVTLYPYIYVSDDSMLSCDWWTYDENGNEVFFDEKGTSLTIDNVTGPTEVFLRVKDGYGNEVVNSAKINIDHYFYIYADEERIAVKKGQTAELKTNAYFTYPLTYAWYDENGNLLSETSDTLITQPVNKRSKYKVVASDSFGNTDEFEFTVYPENNLSLSFINDTPGYGGSYYVDYGADASVEIEVSADDTEGLTIDWELYDENGNTIEGDNTGKTAITVSNVTVDNQLNGCVSVTDKYGTRITEYFGVYIDRDNHFNCEFDGPTTAVLRAGESYKGKLNATAKNMEYISYKWYYVNENGEEVVISTDAEAEFVPNHYGEYYAEAKDTSGHNSGYSTFSYLINIGLENHLTITAAKSDFYGREGDSVTLSAQISADDMNGICVEWRKNNNIISETGNTLTVSIGDKTDIYEIKVSDAYGNTKHAFFYVGVDNGFSVEPGNTMLKGSIGTSVTMVARVSAYNKEGLSCKWYEYYTPEGSDDRESRPIAKMEEGVEPFLSVRVTDYKKEYYLEVEDKYGNNEQIYYSVCVDNNLYVTKNDAVDTIVLLPGETRTISASVTADETDGMVYEWYVEELNNWGYYDSVILCTTDTPELMIFADDAYHSYELRVTDKYGNEDSEYYYVKIENHLVAESNTDEVIYGNPGDLVTLSANVSADDMTDIRYKWYKREKSVDDGYEFYTRKFISETESPELTVEFGGKALSYVLVVTDRYGNEKEVFFTLGFDNKLNVERIGEYSVVIQPGESVTLSALVAMNNRSGSEIKWYKMINDHSSYYKEELSGGSFTDGIASFSFSPETAGEYLLEVKDCYGNAKSIYFDIVIETGLRVYALCGEKIDNSETSVFVNTAGKDEIELGIDARTDSNAYIDYYEWEKLIGTKDHYSAIEIESESEDSIVVPAYERDLIGYRCNAVDNYGNRASVDFYVGDYYVNVFTEHRFIHDNQNVTLSFDIYGNISGGQQFLWEKGTLNENGTYDYSFYEYTDEPVLVIDCVSETKSAYRVNVGDGRYCYYYLELDIINGDQHVRPGQTAKFIINMDGAASYQWMVSADGGQTFKKTSLSGNKTSVLSVAATNARNGYLFYCEVTDSKGNVSKSRVVQLFVEPIVIFDEGPWDERAFEGNTVSFRVAADGEDLSYQWEVSTDGGFNWKNTSLTGNKTDTLKVKATLARDGYVFRCLLKDANGNVVLSNPASLEVMKRLITVQPDDAAVKIGSTATFSVGTIDENLSYQWEVSTGDGENWKNSSLSGNKTAKLSVKLTEARKNWVFRCKVSDGNGNTEYSNEAYLLELPSIEIIEGPVDQSVNEGENAVFEVEAKGENLSYQWMVSADGGENYKNTSLTGNKTSRLTVKATRSRDGYMFGCLITAPDGTSEGVGPVKLTVISPVSIVTQPESVYAETGDTAEFVVKADRDAVSYQWMVSTDGGKSWKNTGMAGNKTAKLTVPVTAGRIGYMFRCVVSDGNTSATSEAAEIMKKQEEYKITVQPVDRPAELNEYVYYTVETNLPDPSYQWQVSTDGVNWNNTGLTGNKTAVLKVQALSNRFLNSYRCVIKSGDIELISNPAALYPAVPPIAIESEPVSRSIKSGEYAYFEVVVNCSTGDTVTYQWEVSTDGGNTWANTGLSGNKTAKLKVQASEKRDGYMFRCQIKAGEAEIVSEEVTLSLLAVDILSQPSDVSTAAGSNAKFTVNAISLCDSTLSYQWQVSKDNGNTWVNSGLTGNKTKTLTVAATSARNGWNFRCVITDGNGKIVNSEKAELTVK